MKNGPEMKRSGRILLVEDESLISLCVATELAKAGYDVCTPAATAEDAIQSARDHQPDLILMDIRLADETSGIEAAAEIRTFSDAAVIFMTGFSDREMMDQARALNPIDYLVKPVPIPKLIRIVDKYFA